MKYKLKLIDDKKRPMSYDEDSYYVHVIQIIDIGEGVDTIAYNKLLDDMISWCTLSGGEIHNRNTFKFENQEDAAMFILRWS